MLVIPCHYLLPSPILSLCTVGMRVRYWHALRLFSCFFSINIHPSLLLLNPMITSIDQIPKAPNYQAVHPTLQSTFTWWTCYLFSHIHHTSTTHSTKPSI